jgi:ACS family tartrate transporter-like MFS transporter
MGVIAFAPMTTAPASPPVEQATIARVTARLIPFIFICYVVAYIDRVNIGFAAVELQRDLGLSDAAFGLGAGLFFLGYCLFEVPSNLVLERVGARLWIARIMVVWGLVSMAMMFVTGVWSFYLLRVLLGIAEAGFFPGVILYLTYWVPAAHRAKTSALFMTAIPVSVIVGAPVSEALLTLDGWMGLRGWQWLFLVEGMPAVLLGIVAFFYLTDRPENASWLPQAQRLWLTDTMARERAARVSRGHGSVLAGLRSGKLWLLCLIYFMNTLVTYGVFLWLPRILRDASQDTGVSLGLLTALPFVVALVGMIAVGRHSDRTGERKWHVAVCALVAASGLVLATFFQDNIPVLVLSFTLSQLGQRSLLSVFWAIPPIFLGGTAAAAGIALINSLGNLGGAVGPTVVGTLRGSSGNYTSGLLVLAAALVIEAILVASMRLPRRDGAAAPAAAATGPVPSR